MRIAFLVDKSAPYFVGGYERRVLSLATELSLRHSVAIFTSIAARAAAVGSVGFYSVAPPWPQAPDNGRRSLVHGALYSSLLLREPRVLRDWAPEVVVVQAIPYLHLWTAAGWLYRRDYRVALDVCEAWWNYPYRVRGIGVDGTRIVRALLGFAARRSHHVLAISATTRASLIANYGLSPESVSVVPLGHSTVVPDPDGGATPLRKNDVLYLNRLVDEKRPFDVLAAIKRLRERAVWDVRATIAGGGPLELPLRAAVVSAGLSSLVDVPGFVSEERKRRLLGDSRVFVLPSEREGFSLATLEAMASGVVPIAARPAQAEVFGVGDYLLEGENGLTYPVGDSDALADAIRNLLSDEPRRLRMARRAKETSILYRLPTVAAGLEAVLRGMQDRAHVVRPEGAGGG